MSSGEDVIENLIGRFGKYQTWIFILVTIARFPAEYQFSNVVFLLPSVDYLCVDENSYNLTNHCPCKQPVYDNSTIGNSVTTTWNLICEKSYLASIAQSILQVGLLAGGVIFSHISDRYGRKMACFLAMLSQVIFTALSAAASDLWMFIICRFLIGAAIGGITLCCYVIIIELSGKSFRPYLAGLIEISYIMGYFTMPIFAYFLRDWKKLQLATSLPWSFVVFYYFLIPESPRWLITMGRKEEAINLLTKIAKWNKRPTENIRSTVENVIKETEREDRKQHGTYLDLFRTPKVRTYTLIMALIWMSGTSTFFGVNQYIGRLQGNIYINIMISAACLIPGIILVVFASLYLRRKISVVTSFFTCGISLLLFLITPSNMKAVGLSFALIGFTGVYTAFAQIYLYSSEIFPTVIRNSAMGFVSVIGRFGGLAAPFVVNIGIEWISIVIFSSLAFFAGCLCYFLPETKDTVLLNTIDQTEKKGNELNKR